MKKLKFRAWNKTNKWMDNEFSIHADGCIYQDARRRWDISDIAIESAYDDLEILQFTGLLDKNGKEIYEGDIVKIRWVQSHWQTHRGDNIPCGFYTEPDESTIDEAIYSIVFIDGAFRVNDSDMDAPHNYLNGNLLTDYINVDYLLMNELDGMDDNYFESEGYSTLFDVKKACGIEVIGNIYENPDLL